MSSVPANPRCDCGRCRLCQHYASNPRFASFVRRAAGGKERVDVAAIVEKKRH